MKKFLIAASAIALLTATVSAQATDSGMTRAQMKTHGEANMHIKKHRRHASTTGSGGYTVNAPRRDYGRYSNLPGKDELNSKAYLFGH